MKLAIWTQYQENYGTASDPHWKMKGGETWVYPNLSAAQATAILNHQTAGTDAIPTLRELIEMDGEMCKNYIVDYKVCDDDEEICAEWETPFELFFTKDDGWHYKHHQFANEFNIWANNIVEIFRSWKMLKGGDVTNFFERYVYASGEYAVTTPSDELEGYVTD